MSRWYEIKSQADVEMSEDGETIDVLFLTDRDGNNYVEIPIKFIKHCLHNNRLHGTLTVAPDTKICANCNKSYSQPVGKDVCPHCGY